MNKIRLLIMFSVGIIIVMVSALYLFTNTMTILEDISNSFAIIGLIVLFPSLIMYLGAFRVFNGFNFAVKSFFSPEFRSKYKKISNYVEDQGEYKKSPVFAELLIISITFIFTSIILSFMI
jgi:hypothetical protein